MSGIIGILNLDGAPVDRKLLSAMTHSLAFRGPDAEQVHGAGPIGFGHTLLKTTRESAHEQQPTSLDGNVWITADARIDARTELIENLRGKGRETSLDEPDALLILHAYHVWGRACVDHLLGDFAFAIWDSQEGRLFCARDHFGVKLLYYARVGNSFFFSNTLNCLWLHPGLSGKLNDLAIADFLLFDFNQDQATTTFAEILRLPAAHILECEKGNVSIRRYWTLPVSAPIQYRRKDEYVERFRELFDTAVADRLRADSAGVLMSGGLDSPTVAASASRMFSSSGDAPGVCAYTQVFDSLIPHEERFYAGLVAGTLQIPIEFQTLDHCRIFDRVDQPEYHGPEPRYSAWPDCTVDQLRHLGTWSRVALTGFGGDPTFSTLLSAHFSQLFKQKRFGRALADAVRYVSTQGRFSRLYVRARWRRLFRSRSQEPWYPEWLNMELEERLALRDRWKALSSAAPPLATVRPEAYEMMGASVWQNLFEQHDPGVTRVPVEVRHPFFDLRLVSFLLALPRLPWCSDKELLREAARGILPDAVRLRRKSPLQADPIVPLLQRPESQWVDRFEPVQSLEKYVIRKRIPMVFRERDIWKAWIHLKPLSLHFWLRWACESGIKVAGEK